MTSTVEQRLNDFLPLIVGFVKPAQLVAHLSSPLELNPNACASIVENTNPSEAMVKLLRMIDQCECPGKYQAFLEALKQAGYKYVASVLEGEPVSEGHDYFHKMVQVFRPNLQEQLNPTEILPELLSTRVLNEEDCQVVIAREQQSGKIAASMVLLDRIPCRLEPHQWYNRFLQAVWIKGQKGLVRQIDPDFENRYTVWLAKTRSGIWSETAAAARKGFATSLMTEYPFRAESQSGTSSETSSLCDEDTFSFESIKEDLMEVSGDAEMTDDNFSPPPDLSKYLPSEEKQQKLNIVGLAGQDKATLQKSKPNVATVTPLVSKKENFSDSEVETLYKRAKSLDDSRLTGAKKLHVETENNLSLPLEMKALNIPTGGQPVSTVQSCVENGENLGDENLDEDGDEEEEPLWSECESDEENNEADVKTKKSFDLRLRKYQLELAETALRGRNTIICAETGSGKTWVALYIVQHHLGAAAAGKRKVAFMARTSTLIKQQCDRFKKHLPQYQTVLLTGENEDSAFLGDMLESYDIFCFTPQILVNSLDSGSVKSLEQFSLIILDECHHTKKDEPYNVLMRKYMAVKLTKNIHNLPQVVGLTASVGVGKRSRTDQDAVDYIISICANMDVFALSTVQKYKEEIRKHVNLPKEEKIPMVERRDDPCKDELIKGMLWIEDKLEGSILFEPSLLEMVHNRSSDKASQEYMQWTRLLIDSAIKHVSDPDDQRFIVSCATYLGVFNEALEMNSLLGIRDVVKFFAKKFQEEKRQRAKLTDDEREMYEKLEGIQRSLSKMWVGKVNENPNLQLLSNTLRKMLEEKGDDSRAMVFVKTRPTCTALAEYLNKTLKEIGVECHQLMGKAGKDSGMTESEQEEAVEKFRTGEYKVLVATSIGGEGLDVAECNIVLSYNYTGNEISKIQMSGRSRKKGGTTVLLGDSRTMRQETISTYKAAMMYRAIKRVKDMKYKDLERKIQTLQKEDFRKEGLRQNIKKSKERNKIEGNFALFCSRCNAFAVGAENIRKVKESHHFVIEKGFEDRIEVKPHNSPRKIDGFTKTFKMHCKGCPQDWGVIFDYQGVPCRTLLLKSFKVTNLDSGESKRCKQWIEAPFKVPSVEVDELAALMN